MFLAGTNPPLVSMKLTLDSFDRATVDRIITTLVIVYPACQRPNIMSITTRQRLLR